GALPYSAGTRNDEKGAALREQACQGIVRSLHALLEKVHARIVPCLPRIAALNYRLRVRIGPASKKGRPAGAAFRLSALNLENLYVRCPQPLATRVIFKFELNLLALMELAITIRLNGAVVYE